jgi:tetratricopeptide (TPR) repeat protein
MAQYDQGTDYFLKALELWRKAGDKRGEAFASYGLGRIFQYQGRYGAALKSQEDALKSWRATNDHGAWLPEIQGGYGSSLSMLGRWDDAQKNLDEALGLARQVKSDSLVAEMLNYKGDNFFYRGDTQSAKTLFEQASQSAASSKDPEQILISKFNLAKVAASERQTPDVINSLTALARDLDRSGLKRLSIECSTYVAAARIHSKNYSQAQELLEASVTESQKLGLNVLLAKSHYLLAETLRLSGNETEALHHYSEAHRIVDEIRKEAQSDDLMKRPDLADIYQQSARWQNPTT